MNMAAGSSGGHLAAEVKGAMRLATWNVNGLRSVHGKGWLSWLKTTSPDVVCLQEIKIDAESASSSPDFLEPLGYFSNWNCAKKKGYSGLVIYTKKPAANFRVGLGDDELDEEGRWLEIEVDYESEYEYEYECDDRFKKNRLTVINSYWPNSSRDHSRLPDKLRFCALAEARLQQLRKEGRNVVICGDFNIAHKEIDLKNPKSNRNNAGFLPEERAWMTHFIENLGWVDLFRKFEPGPDHYTWWSYRPGVREKNVGWRLDYIFSNPEFAEAAAGVKIQSDVYGSDHCPVIIDLK